MTGDIARGWPLTVFLLLAGLLSAFAIATYGGLMGDTLLRQFPRWTVTTFLVVACLRLVAIIAIWYWIKEGVVGYVLLTLIVIPLSYAVGIRSTILSLLGIALLVYLVRNKWAHMRWVIAPANNRWSGP